ncbi:MAG: DUF1292 domain-containing protein [Clostridiales bacterium]|jgi:hypothetical protein|nr:DUF1292 domain-containing protein [Clostridiales bacterium]
MTYEDKDCGCGCGADHENCIENGAEDCGCEEQETITMVDAETGEEYQFAVVDGFEFKDQAYCVLVTVDEEDPELVITKVVELDNGEEGLMSLEEAESDEVYAEYDRLCEEADVEDEDEESEEE